MTAPDIQPLLRATARLEEGLARYATDTDDGQIRDGLIQRFEFTYDLAPKMLARVLGYGAPAGSPIAQMSFPALIRTATEKELIGDTWIEWRQFRTMRNTTSHTYDEDKAREVVAAIPAFLASVQDMLKRLERRGYGT